MAIFRNISVGFWSDRKVLSKFSAEDKYFFIYLLTNDSTELSGCYELNVEDASCDLSYTVEAVVNLLRRMETYHKVIRINKLDDTHYEVLVLNWHKYNWNRSVKQIQGVKYCLNKIKTPEFREYVSEKLAAVEGKKNKDVPDQSVKTATKTAMQPPTCDDVEAYCKDMGYEFDWWGFWFYYDRYGWKDANGNPIANWMKYLDACEKSGTFKKIG